MLYECPRSLHFAVRDPLMAKGQQTGFPCRAVGVSVGCAYFSAGGARSGRSVARSAPQIDALSRPAHGGHEAARGRISLGSSLDGSPDVLRSLAFDQGIVHTERFSTPLRTKKV